jgi:hypothetical protein
MDLGGFEDSDLDKGRQIRAALGVFEGAIAGAARDLVNFDFVLDTGTTRPLPGRGEVKNFEVGISDILGEARKGNVVQIDTVAPNGDVASFLIGRAPDVWRRQPPNPDGDYVMVSVAPDHTMKTRYLDKEQLQGLSAAKSHVTPRQREGDPPLRLLEAEHPIAQVAVLRTNGASLTPESFSPFLPRPTLPSPPRSTPPLPPPQRIQPQRTQGPDVRSLSGPVDVRQVIDQGGHLTIRVPTTGGDAFVHFRRTGNPRPEYQMVIQAPQQQPSFINLSPDELEGFAVGRNQPMRRTLPPRYDPRTHELLRQFTFGELAGRPITDVSYTVPQ